MSADVWVVFNDESRRVAYHVRATDGEFEITNIVDRDTTGPVEIVTPTGDICVAMLFEATGKSADVLERIELAEGQAVVL